MPKKKDNVGSLLAAIQRQTTPTISNFEPIEEFSAPSQMQQAKKQNRLVVKSQPIRTQLYMQEEDRRIIRELAAWLAGQGLRASDSLIIRAALRLTKTGGDLLNTYRQLAQMDGRFKQVD